MAGSFFPGNILDISPGSNGLFHIVPAFSGKMLKKKPCRSKEGKKLLCSQAARTAENFFMHGFFLYFCRLPFSEWKRVWLNRQTNKLNGVTAPDQICLYPWNR
jgi:hypothetical protein